MWHQEAILVALQTTGFVSVYMRTTQGVKIDRVLFPTSPRHPPCLAVRVPQSGSIIPFTVVHNQTVTHLLHFFHAVV